MGPETEADLKTLKGDFSRLQADVVKLTATIQQLIQHGRREGTAEAAATLDGVEASLRQRAEGLAQQVQEKPLAAVGMTFFAGLMLGVLFGGRR